MISEDTSIGIAVLFSYNYAHLFHKCIVAFISDTTCELVSNPDYIKLKQLFTK